MNKGTNSTKITISLKKAEREALQQEAKRRGVPVSRLCAEYVRRYIKIHYQLLERAKRTRETDKDGE